LEEKKQYLEHHWVLAGKELDQEKELRTKIQKEQYEDFERILRDEKEKNSTLRKNYDQQIEDLKLAHSKHCDELGKQILKATLEADRLHNQLVGAPRKTKIFETKSSSTILARFLITSIFLLVSRRLVMVALPTLMALTHTYCHSSLPYLDILSICLLGLQSVLQYCPAVH
jgi:hypothetical protein